MSQKECVRDCIFGENGVCRLENNHGIKQPQCPYREGSLVAVALL